jgi:hypothetical protein
MVRTASSKATAQDVYKALQGLRGSDVDNIVKNEGSISEVVEEWVNL